MPIHPGYDALASCLAYQEKEKISQGGTVASSIIRAEILQIVRLSLGSLVF